MNIMIVHTLNKQWMLRAMHLACAISRNNNSPLILLRLIPVQNPGLLGSSVGNMLSLREQRELEEYAEIAEDYGVSVGLQLMEYLSYTDAIMQIVEMLNVSAVFAHSPRHFLHVFTRLQEWNLRRQLNTHNCELYTLEKPVGAIEWSPSIHFKPLK